MNIASGSDRKLLRVREMIDLKLPRLRSSEAIWRIRQEPKLHKLPIVAVSTNHSGKIPLDRLTVHANRPIEFSLLDSFISRFLPQYASLASHIAV